MPWLIPAIKPKIAGNKTGANLFITLEGCATALEFPTWETRIY